MLVLGACGAPSSVAPPAPAPQAHITVDAAAPPAKAHWFASGGATGSVQVLSQGKLVLLGGRRVLVDPDGTTHSETAAGPLRQLVLAPTAAGDRLVGSGPHGLYRFDDPLGAPKVLATTKELIVRIGAGPGFVAVWALGKIAPVALVDVQTGGVVTPPPGWPRAPLRQLAFHDMREGVLDFWKVGLSITTDGGSTFRPLAEGAPSDASSTPTVERAGSEIQLRPETGSSHAIVDFASARASELQKDEPESAPILRWVQATGTDPLREAVEDGVLASETSAIVDHGGLLARVDLGTGMITDLLSHGETECELGRLSSLASGPGLLVCPGHPLRSFPLSGRLAVVAMPFQVPAAAKVRRGPGTALLLDAPCTADDTERRAVCVLQPGAAAFASVGVPAAPDAENGWDPFWHPYPLEDGRVALFHRGGTSGPPRIAILEKHAAPRELAPIEIPKGTGDSLGVQGDAELGPDGALYALVEATFEAAAPPFGRQPEPVVYRLRQPLDGTPATLTDLQVLGGWFRRGHVVVFTPDAVRVSNDAGATWRELPQSPRDALWDADDPPANWRATLMRAVVVDRLSVGEGGIRLGPLSRAGWGAADQAAAPWASMSGGSVIGSRPDSARTISCTSGTTAAPAPGLENQARQAVFDQLERPPPKGTRREMRDGSWVGFDESRARLELSASEGAERPALWTLRWTDPFEPGQPVHTWTGPTPKTATWSGRLTAVAARRGVVVFAVEESGSSGELVALSPGRGPRVEPMPDTDVARRIVLDEAGTLAAWTTNEARRLYGWPLGERPRILATLADKLQASAVQVGIPTRRAVPLAIADGDDVWIDEIAWNRAADAPLSLAQWTDVDLGTATACAKGTRAEVLVPASHRTKVAIDGHTPYPMVSYGLGRGPEGLPCIAEVRAELVKSSQDGADDVPRRYLFSSLTSGGSVFEQVSRSRVRSVRCELRTGSTGSATSPR